MVDVLVVTTVEVKADTMAAMKVFWRVVDSVDTLVEKRVVSKELE